MGHCTTSRGQWAHDNSRSTTRTCHDATRHNDNRRPPTGPWSLETPAGTACNLGPGLGRPQVALSGDNFASGFPIIIICPVARIGRPALLGMQRLQRLRPRVSSSWWIPPPRHANSQAHICTGSVKYRYYTIMLIRGAVVVSSAASASLFGRSAMLTW
ncbi:hypothetical protein BGZ61DRAFT_450147 [Ilyonectria robusta]|uniref:uncharacterized protein n=1 Tax=Ilyonectria robusta TaxID=1079257 RepID=UPI001E8D81F6|nr:uncharacterized protein BGZ61DRAFT_450147 [Ilyonectria robusta]KAH8706578.1 hypothetical protein BGZ61DRAFT_450147 [Ilyonectria robusta]